MVDALPDTALKRSSFNFNILCIKLQISLIIRNHKFSILLISSDCAFQLVHLILFLSMKTNDNPSPMYCYHGTRSRYRGNVLSKLIIKWNQLCQYILGPKYFCPHTFVSTPCQQMYPKIIT